MIGVCLAAVPLALLLLGFPIWVGYAGMLPGVFLAGIVALAQSCGIKVAEPVAEHVSE